MIQMFESRKLTGPIRLTLSTKEKWTADKGEIAFQMRKITTAYQRDGYRMTLRQLYYRLVSAEIIRNDDVVYKKIGDILGDMRIAGQIDWSIIEDRGRAVHRVYSNDDLEDALSDAITFYRRDRRENQPQVVELAVEKDALSGVIKPVADKYGLNLMVNKGYTSLTAIYALFQRVKEAYYESRPFTLLYLGDHDPSGLDMIRDIRERVCFMISRSMRTIREEAFDWWETLNVEQQGEYLMYDDLVKDQTVCLSLALDTAGVEFADLSDADFDKLVNWYCDSTGLFKVKPIGLTMAQIEEFNPPPNPAKLTDVRAAKYVAEFGEISWELDALPPDVLTGIIRDAVEEILDMDIYNECLKKEEKDKTALQSFIDSYKEEEAGPDDDEDTSDDSAEDDDYDSPDDFEE